MRVLITTDTVGGVWQYTLALARGLVERHRCQVSLACFGEPAESDLEDTGLWDSVECSRLPFKLEWMPDSHRDVALARDEVTRLARDWGADIVHANQFCMGSSKTRIPKIVVAHSDVLGWITWHRNGGEPQGRRPYGDPALDDYRRLVVGGLEGADAVVSPSNFMARSLESSYGVPSMVIHNGLWPDLYHPMEKEAVALVVGRLWDESKQAGAAVEAVAGLPLELRMVGPTTGPTGETCCLPSAPNARRIGPVNWRLTRDIIGRARFYLATASYEPFGLAALEAALSGCAIVANDIPGYREIWEGAAVFYRRNDASDLHEKLATLLSAPGEAERAGRACRQRALARYSADGMADAYFALYSRLVDDHRWARELNPPAGAAHVALHADS